MSGTLSPNPGKRQIGRFIWDACTWAACLFLLGVMHAAGLVKDPALSLAASAFWFALRAHGKRGEG